MCANMSVNARRSSGEWPSLHTSMCVSLKIVPPCAIFAELHLRATNKMFLAVIPYAALTDVALRRPADMKLLHIDSSISGGQSVSRQLTASIVARLKQTTPGLEITYRDLAIAPVPHQSPTILFAKMKARPERWPATSSQWWRPPCH